ncbi:MAG TPA: hypothetical protein VLD58_17380 [Gemmatimonadales bacterium]|nr:hypothetical protein [Gemmatimonadales bacterium]
MRPLLISSALLVAACTGAARDVPVDQPPAQAAALPADAGLTPGVCGPWETADSASRATCRKRIFPPGSGDLDMLASADCTYDETTSLDSLRACLGRMDSSARQCPVVQSWPVRQGDGISRVAEWRRCGVQGGEYRGDSIAWPLHFLIIRRDTVALGPAIFSYSNSAEPGSGGLDTALVVDLDGDGSDELVFVGQVYGTGAIFEECTLAVVERTFRCWSGPEFPPRGTALREGEVLMKGWLRSFGPPGADRETAGPAYATGKSLWYETPVYREGDPNCCNSTLASLWVEAVPAKGRFETGRWLRVTEDSNQAIVRIDTLRH